MRDEDANLFYLPGGPIAAILLGVALIPLRESTNSANFIFVFMVLIIVVAEYGGRWAAIVTAACSALSLNFFLTQPYLSLRIEGKHDFIAFAGLTVCGLVAAALGSRRGDAVSVLRRARVNLDLLHEVAVRHEEAGPSQTRLEEALRACRDRLPLAGLVLRDSRNDVIAASGSAPAPRPAPVLPVGHDTLLPSGVAAAELPRGGAPFPAEGISLPLESGGRQVGRLDLWGDGRPADLETRRALSDVARLLAAMIDR